MNTLHAHYMDQVLLLAFGPEKKPYTYVCILIIMRSRLIDKKWFFRWERKNVSKKPNWTAEDYQMLVLFDMLCIQFDMLW